MPTPLIVPLSVKSIREIEQDGLEHDLPLMLEAGAAAASFLMDRFPPTAAVLSLVGPGNNGGDALVASSRLVESGYNVQVVMPILDAPLPTDAAAALHAWHDLEGTEGADLPKVAPDVVIDGLFGIGLNRRLESPWQDVIDTVNSWKIPVLSLDIPSGLHADTGELLGRPVQATWTLAFIAPTRALIEPISKGYAGRVEVQTLGLPYQEPREDEDFE